MGYAPLAYFCHVHCTTLVICFCDGRNSSSTITHACAVTSVAVFAYALLPPHQSSHLPCPISALLRCYCLLQDQWLERHAGYGRTDPGYVTSSGEADSASSLSE